MRANLSNKARCSTNYRSGCVHARLSLPAVLRESVLSWPLARDPCYLRFQYGGNASTITPSVWERKPLKNVFENEAKKEVTMRIASLALHPPHVTSLQFCGHDGNLQSATDADASITITVSGGVKLRDVTQEQGFYSIDVRVISEKNDGWFDVAIDDAVSLGSSLVVVWQSFLDKLFVNRVSRAVHCAL